MIRPAGNIEKVINENTEIAQFEEDGDLIQMEINDGGAAAAEFASEEEFDQTIAEVSDPESDQESVESGQIDTVSDKECDTDLEDNAAKDYVEEVASPKVKKHKSKSSKC